MQPVTPHSPFLGLITSGAHDTDLRNVEDFNVIYDAVKRIIRPINRPQIIHIQTNAAALTSDLSRYGATR